MCPETNCYLCLESLNSRRYLFSIFSVFSPIARFWCRTAWKIRADLLSGCNLLCMIYLDIHTGRSQ